MPECRRSRLVANVERIILSAQKHVVYIMPMPPKVNTVAVCAPAKDFDVFQSVWMSPFRYVSAKYQVMAAKIDERDSSEIASGKSSHVQSSGSVPIMSLPMHADAREHAKPKDCRIVQLALGLYPPVEPSVGRQIVALVASEFEGLHKADVLAQC